MDNYFHKIFTIHFPGKKVYIANTCLSIIDKMECIKNDKDHRLYLLLKEYPNPEIRVECCDKKSVALKYRKDNYKVLNVNVLPYNYKANI